MRGRELHVECLAGTWDFRQWLLPIELHIKGLVATQKEPEANHVWRIVARSDLDALGLTEASVVCQHSDWAALPPEPEDAILLLKRRMHSTKLSQDPLILLPKAVAAKLNPADLKPAETNELGEATCKEFRKTAQAMGKQPWNLLKAEEYLQKLCTRNESMMLPEMPEPPHVIFNYTMAKIGVPNSHWVSSQMVCKRCCRVRLLLRSRLGQSSQTGQTSFLDRRGQQQLLQRRVQSGGQLEPWGLV